MMIRMLGSVLTGVALTFAACPLLPEQVEAQWFRSLVRGAESVAPQAGFRKPAAVTANAAKHSYAPRSLLEHVAAGQAARQATTSGRTLPLVMKDRRFHFSRGWRKQEHIINPRALPIPFSSSNPRYRANVVVHQNVRPRAESGVRVRDTKIIDQVARDRERALREQARALRGRPER